MIRLKWKWHPRFLHSVTQFPAKMALHHTPSSYGSVNSRYFTDRCPREQNLQKHNTHIALSNPYDQSPCVLRYVACHVARSLTTVLCMRRFTVRFSRGFLLPRDSCPIMRRMMLYDRMASSKTSSFVSNFPDGRLSRTTSVFSSLWNCPSRSVVRSVISYPMRTAARFSVPSYVRQPSSMRIPMFSANHCLSQAGKGAAHLSVADGFF